MMTVLPQRCIRDPGNTRRTNLPANFAECGATPEHRRAVRPCLFASVDGDHVEGHHRLDRLHAVAVQSGFVAFSFGTGLLLFVRANFADWLLPFGLGLLQGTKQVLD